MPTTLLTDIAETKITAAAGTGSAVAITHVALGDGNGSNYAPGHAQTGLRREMARQPIATRHIEGGNAWRVRAEFGPETPAFAVREMGFFDADGDLIAVWAGNDVEPRQTGAISYLIDHVLSFTRVADGLVIVEAPDDELAEARGDFNRLGARLDAMDQYSPADQVAMAAGVQQAMNLGGVLLREMDVMRRRVLAQGVALIRLKHVIAGMQLTKSEVRTLHLSQTGTVGAGLSKAKLDGLIVALPDDDYHVSVPTNETGSPVQYFAYLVKSGGVYGVDIGASVPDEALALYRIDIPAGDTASNLNAVTLVDLRVIQAENAWTSVIEPFAAVAFADALPSADYMVSVEIEDATNIAAVGDVVIYDKANNGFKIGQTGSADNVRIRWTAINPNYQ
ncbi:phage tail protein [Sulfitobacter sp. OXR-159]|uniref:phage tail-collar fiber domain-containing protein n=1 Tax=Sulfitobacter sp. OXR-159 TaxID=3100174 RepID=UPI002AC9DFF2|nr:phage tail protein [Sulfitobacter sp. OXR-159]WPZ28191.1 phage tail protein [Sulfitobacter sp. OXR-159]